MFKPLQIKRSLTKEGFVQCDFASRSLLIKKLTECPLHQGLFAYLSTRAK